MPRRRKQRPRRRRAPRSRGRRSAPAPASPVVDLHPVLSQVSLHLKAAASRSDTPTLLDLEEKKAPAPLKTDPAVRALRSIFKADIPYRTRIGYSTSLSVTGGTAVNIVFNNATLNTTPEWSSIDALFDEFFIHSMHVRFQPLNVLGGGFGQGSSTNLASRPALGTSGTNLADQPFNFNSGLTLVSLFVNAPTYTTQSAMESNPTKRHVMSGSPWVYTWRNNVRFDSRGLSLAPLTSIGWQGWTQIAESGFYGGQIQLRTTNDVVFGSGAGTITLGAVAVTWDVSFRARS